MAHSHIARVESMLRLLLTLFLSPLRMHLCIVCTILCAIDKGRQWCSALVYFPSLFSSEILLHAAIAPPCVFPGAELT